MTNKQLKLTTKDVQALVSTIWDGESWTDTMAKELPEFFTNGEKEQATRAAHIAAFLSCLKDGETLTITIKD